MYVSFSILMTEYVWLLKFIKSITSGPFFYIYKVFIQSALRLKYLFMAKMIYSLIAICRQKHTPPLIPKINRAEIIIPSKIVVPGSSW